MWFAVHIALAGGRKSWILGRSVVGLHIAWQQWAVRRLWLIAVPVTLIAACGSSHRLNSRATTIRSFASSAKCAQGPFEVTVPAKGHRWGEALELRVSTPRRVKLIASVEPEGGFATKTERLLGGRGTRPDNQRCVVSVDEVGKSATSSGGGSPGAPGAPDGAGGGGGTTTTVTAKPPTLVSVPAVGRGQTLVRVSWRNPSLEPPRLRAGAKIRIRIWSIVPNDLAGVVFSLRRILYVPNKGDAAFVAHLKRLREKRQRRREERRHHERRGVVGVVGALVEHAPLGHVVGDLDFVHVEVAPDRVGQAECEHRQDPQARARDYDCAFTHSMIT